MRAAEMSSRFAARVADRWDTHYSAIDRKFRYG
jgi:hypothetical protein